MTSYGAIWPTSPVPPRSWRQAAERQHETTRATLRATIQRAKASGLPPSPEVVVAFAAVHMTTDRGGPIVAAPHHWLWLRLMCDPFIRRLLIIGTPESAKTTWALAYAACLIGFYPERPGIIAASSGGVASKRSLALRNIVSSDEFKLTFPGVCAAAGMSWREDEWSVAPNGTPHDGRLHPTVSAYGTGGSITGSRAAWLIGDDILDFDNTRTQGSRNTTDTWLHKSLLSRSAAKTGRVVIIGNAWHHDDSHARLRQNPEWATCHIPLLSDGPEVYATITYPDNYAGRPLGKPQGLAL